MQVHIEMPAPHPLAQNFPDARLNRFESFRQPQMQIEKPVIHAADRDAQIPIILHRARLRVSRHRLQAGHARLRGIHCGGL